jgi:hypothetical protein
LRRAWQESNCGRFRPGVPGTDFDGELDRLYQRPLGEFTAARNDLAKRLRAEGQSERAEAVKGLRKPSAAVWLVNQLAHERQLDVQRLLKAGESLAKTQANAAAGSSDSFSEARRDEQRALTQLAKAAHEIAARGGIGAPAVDRATATLRAASLTSEGRELLRRGRLTEELEPPGFEALAGFAKPAQTRAASKRDEKQQAREEARERVRQLRAEERELVKAARAAAREAERAEAEAEAARKRADAAEEQAQAMSDRRRAAEADAGRLG